ncbi:LysR family transcriptional regulator [Xenorhabdus kozodoii]|nr:LysR family transcriptional regulator [Xenorhabdus kozodoii]
MAIFVQVIESSGISAAARKLNMTPSAISKAINRLENRLGVRLLNRTTRKIQLTPEGTVYYNHSVNILENISSVEREVTQGVLPRGKIRVNCHIPFGKHYLMPMVSTFLQKYPAITLDIILCDQVVDLLDDRSDVAIRTGPLADSRLVVRRLGSSRMVVVGAPHYFEYKGTPVIPEDLVNFNCLNFSFTRHVKTWPFKNSKGINLFSPHSNLLIGDGEAMREAVILGLGIARMARFHVAPDIKAGRLQVILENHNPGDEEEVHAVFIGPSNQVPTRVRVFLDFLTEFCYIKN